jgi:hypothetical protein
MAKQKIREYLGSFGNYKILSLGEQEKKAGGVLMKVGGVFQVEDEKNRNNRIYPSSTWDSVFEDQEWREQLNHKGVLGEMDHPKDGGALRRTSHIITKLERQIHDGKKVIYGEAEILDTPEGQVAATLFKAGARVGISSRGEGSVESDESQGADVVQKDYRPEAFDFVTKPSTHGAYPSPLTEAEVKQNESIAIKALSGLVESTADKKILLSCYRTLEGYRDNPQGLSVLSRLEEKLTNSEIRKEEFQEDLPMDLQEKEKIQKEAQEELLRMARDLAKTEVDKIRAECKESVDKLNSQIASLSETKIEQDKKLDAAYKLIEAYGEKTAELKEGVGDTSKLEETQKRLDAAKSLIRECMKIISEQRESGKYAEAAEKVAQALLDKRQDEKVSRYIEGALAGVKDESARSYVMELLGKPRTLKEAREKLTALSKLLPKEEKLTEGKEPLPGTKRNLKEALVPGRVSQTLSFTEKLASKLGY